MKIFLQLTFPDLLYIWLMCALPTCCQALQLSASDLAIFNVSIIDKGMPTLDTQCSGVGIGGPEDYSPPPQIIWHNLM